PGRAGQADRRGLPARRRARRRIGVRHGRFRDLALRHQRGRQADRALGGARVRAHAADGLPRQPPHRPGARSVATVRGATFGVVPVHPGGAQRGRAGHALRDPAPARHEHGGGPAGHGARGDLARAQPYAAQRNPQSQPPGDRGARSRRARARDLRVTAASPRTCTARLWPLLGALGLALACNEPATTGATPPPPAAAEPEPEPECRDWSTLDPSELPPLTEGAHAPLLDQVWRRVLEKHYDPTLGCLRWGALREVYARKVAEAATDAEAYAHINAMLDELGQSHLRLFPPPRDEDTAGPASPALTVRWIEDGLVVVRSEAVGPQGPVHAGATLLAINDEPVETLIERVRARAEPHAFPLEVSRAVAARLSCERAGQVRKLKVTDPTKNGAKSRTHGSAEDAEHRAIRV